MATFDDVRRCLGAFPGVTEGTSRGDMVWKVSDRLVAWERPLRRSDHQALGDTAPDGPILAARVPDEGAKFALVADDSGIYFTTPHFDDHPIVLVRLEDIPADELEELLEEAWLDQAPPRLAREYLDNR